MGDIGEAIYQWGDRVHLKFLAGCNPDYFAEKCRGIDGLPDDVQEWDAESAQEYLEQGLAEENGWWDDDETRRKKVAFFEENGGFEALESRGSWQEWLHDHGEEFMDDWWECLPDAGDVINLRVLGHLVGLKMAHAQLEGKQDGG